MDCAESVVGVEGVCGEEGVSVGDATEGARSEVWIGVDDVSGVKNVCESLCED